MIMNILANAGVIGSVSGLEKEIATIPVFWMGKSHGQRSLTDYSPWGHKESDKTLQLSMHDNSNIERPFMYVLNVFMSSL